VAAKKQFDARLEVRLPAALKRRAAHVAVDQGIELGDLVRLAIERYCACWERYEERKPRK
jgi:hypothetical protein